LIVKCLLIAGMKEDYPSDSSILVEAENRKGLSGDQVDELKVHCAKVATENIGMPNVFMVSSAAQEWLLENNIPGTDGSMYAGKFFFSNFSS
jgi:aminoglycoside phosphotransferase